MSTDPHDRRTRVAAALVRHWRTIARLAIVAGLCALVAGVSSDRSSAALGRLIPTAPAPAAWGTPPPRASLAATSTKAVHGPNWAPYPQGPLNPWEVSGREPPGPHALKGYTQVYAAGFPGDALAAGWTAFTGQPGGDVGAQFAASHVTVQDGVLSLNTWRDPAYGDEWVTGGVCLCSLPLTYGAYFVRSRVTGPGPTQVELLWPADNQWPPEVDFDESWGTQYAVTGWLHYAAGKAQGENLVINLTHWHTFGVIWSPGQVTYIVDGKAWVKFKTHSEIPDLPMTLDLTQQTWCSEHWACPWEPQSMQVNWVAVYSRNP